MNTSLEKLISAFLAFREHFNQWEKKHTSLWDITGKITNFLYHAISRK